MRNALGDVDGVSVGHWSNPQAGTGCTVILTPAGATAGVDVRGSSPGTRETDLLDPTCRVDRVHAVLLSGGSAFGLAAAEGVMRWLEERGYGWPTLVQPVPIVPAAIVFDLGVGEARVRPTGDNAYAACESASPEEIGRGNVGAGTGCTVGKLAGLSRATKGGLGQASRAYPGGVVVAGLVAVNAVGDVVDPARNAIIAGARDQEGRRLVDGLRMALEVDGPVPSRRPSRENTTIGVVATNARLSKVMCAKLARMAHNGLARTLRPAHTMFDGDCLFAVATGAGPEVVDVSLLGAAAADMVAHAVLDAVRSARAAYGLPAASDLEPLPLAGPAAR